jgi:hypothetical protein
VEKVCQLKKPPNQRLEPTPRFVDEQVPELHGNLFTLARAGPASPGGDHAEGRHNRAGSKIKPNLRILPHFPEKSAGQAQTSQLKEHDRVVMLPSLQNRAGSNDKSNLRFP